MDFSGQRIWIIGASAGIGAAVAEALAAQGAHVILSARSRSALETIAQRCKDAEVLPVDLADREGFAATVATMPARSLDMVICTAALYDPGPVADLDAVAVETLVRVNLLGSLDVARLTPPLLRDGGKLVLFGSVAGYIGLPGGQAYSATKAAVNNLAETLRIELAPRVDVRLVCPGFVETRLTEKNDFAMPARITAEKAAQEILRGLRRRAFEIHFPKRFTLGVKLLAALPYAMSMPLLGRLR